MRISIITVCYNSSATILKTLQSVQNQFYNDIEHVIVDGGSTDNTVELIKQFGFKGCLISERDKGIYDAMNKGISMATGDVIGLLNSDDFYPNRHIISSVAAAFLASRYDAVYGDLLYVDPRNNQKVTRTWVAGGYNDKLFYRGWMPPHPSFFVRKEVYDKYGSFNLQLKSSADYELMLRFLFCNKIRASYIPTVLVHMQSGGQSNLSLKNRLAAHKEDYLAWEMNGFEPKWYTLFLKPMRKLHQFVTIKRKIFNNNNVDMLNNESSDTFTNPFRLENTA